MGWLYTHKPATESVADFFRRRWNYEGDDHCAEVLDVAVVRLRTAYLAVRRTGKADGKSFVFGVVCLLGYDRSDPDYNFGYKDITETMGPTQSDCPRRILELLSDFEDFPDGGNDYAREWRERCWKRIRQRETLKRHPNWGVLLPRPARFDNGETVQLFRKARVHGRRNCFTGWNDKGLYKPPLDMDYLILTPEQTGPMWLFLHQGGRLEERYWHHDRKHELHRVFFMRSSSLRLKAALEAARVLHTHEDALPVLLQVAQGGPLSMYRLDAKGNPVLYEDNRPLVMTCAHGDLHELVPEGYVGLVARKGGQYGTDEGRFFLVDETEYETWKNASPDLSIGRSFVIDPDRHREVPTNTPPPVTKERRFDEVFPHGLSLSA